MMKFIVILFIFSFTNVNGQLCQANTCQNVYSPVGFRDDNNQLEKVNADCCNVGGQGTCYLSEYQQCGNDGTNMNGDIICPKKGFVPCRDLSGTPTCCNTFNYRCEVYSEKNGHKVSRCVPKLNNPYGFYFVALPLLFTLFTLLALVVLFIYHKDTLQGDVLDKAAFVVSFLIIFFAIFYYYSIVFVYGVVMVVTSAIGLRTLGASTTSARFVAFFAYLFLFFSIIGWGQGNSIIGGWGSGIFNNLDSCNGLYGNYFQRSSTTSAKWDSPYSAVRAGKDPSLIGQNWGYCDSGWVFTLKFFSLFELAFISFMLISMARRLYQQSC